MQKAIRYTVMILLVAISFFGILGPILNPPKPLPPHLVNFGKTQALEDYDTMWRLIEENYPFLLQLPHTIGLEPQQVKATYRAQLTARETVSVETFNNILTNCLREFRGTGHMNVLSPSVYASSLSSWNAFSPEIKQIEMATFAPLLEENTRAFYDYMSGTPRKTTSEEDGSLSENLKIQLLDETTAYLNIATFDHGYIENDRPNMEAFWQEVHNIPNVIIDIRQNGGGSVYWWMDLIISPNIIQPLLMEGKFLVMDGEINRQRYSDQFSPEAQDFSDVSTLPSIHQPTLEQMDYLLENSFYIQPMPSAVGVYPGNIYLLIGEQVYSASEGLAYACKVSGFATLVGTQTSGDGAPAGGGTMAFVSLPNSGMIFRMQTSYTLNPDGSSNTLYGTTPHVVIGPKEDALEVCRRLIFV